MPTEEWDRHVWVQASRGPTWVDMDPTLPGFGAGERLADAATTLDATADLPRHLVTFRVVAESVASGALRTSVVLEHPVPADELVGRRITFALEKPDGLRALGAGIADGVAGTVQYAPLLVVDEDVVLANGYVRFGAADDPFEGALPGSPGEGETTALWLEVMVESPGAPPRVARRTVFDRVGDAARRDGTFDPARMEPVELVDLDGSGSLEHVPCLAVHLISVAGSWSLPMELVGSASEPPLGYDALAAFYHWMREAVGAAWSAPLGARPFCDGPNVAAVVLTPAMDGDELGVSVGVDLLSRSLGSVGVDGIAVPEGPGVLAGVVSHVAERMLMGDTGVPIEESAVAPASVGRVFEEAERQRIPLTVLDGSASVPTFDHPGGGEASGRIANALRDGYVVVVPERPVALDGTSRLGWWLVDPASGAAFDVLDTGGGATLTGWGRIIWNAWRAAPLWQRLGICTLVAFEVALATTILQDMATTSATKGMVSAGGNALGIPLGAACGP
jgi:hypothetical protein